MQYIDLMVLGVTSKSPSFVNTQSRVKAFSQYLEEYWSVKIPYLKKDPTTILELYKDYISLEKESSVTYDKLTRRISDELGYHVYQDIVLCTRFLYRTTSLIQSKKEDIISETCLLT